MYKEMESQMTGAVPTGGIQYRDNIVTNIVEA